MNIYSFEEKLHEYIYRNTHTQSFKIKIFS